MPPANGQPQELWLGDDNGQLRGWAQTLILEYQGQLGPLDLSKVVFFRILNGRDPRKKGVTYRLMPPYTHMHVAVQQLVQYTEGEDNVFLKNTEKLDPRFAIAIYDDKHKDDADRLYTVLHELYHIDPSMAKLRDHDLKEHYWLVERFGLGTGKDLAEFQKLLTK
jgi:hypothetical protein